MQSAEFNAVGAIATLKARWKTLLFLVLTTMVLATVAVFIVPPYYKSSARLVAANPLLADKASLFHENIRELYSQFGSGDDLDRLMGMGMLGDHYQELVTEFDLVNYYQTSGDSLPIQIAKAAKRLQQDLRFIRTDEGQLEIYIWTKDKQLSANIVNAMIRLIEKTGSAILLTYYQTNREQLNHAIVEAEKTYRSLADSMRRADAPQAALLLAHQQSVLQDLQQYRKTQTELQLISSQLPALLHVLQAASPAVRAERPDKPMVILASGLAALLFGTVLVLLSDRKK